MSENTDRSSRNKIIKRAAAALLLIAALLCSVIFCELFLCIPKSQEFDQNRILMLHKEPENSIDVLLIGSSAVYSGFSSALAYDEFGFTSYPYAVGGATCTLWRPALNDALRTQHPKLVVIDVFGGGYERELIETRSSQLYNVMSSYPLSAEKVMLAREISRSVDNTSTASMVFPFIKCHSNIPANLRNVKSRLEVYRSGTSPLKGMSVRSKKRRLKDVDSASFSDESAPLDPKTEATIREFMDYCRSEDVNVLFAKFPSVLTTEDPDELLVNLRANRILEIADEEGFHTLNMQKNFHDIGLRERKDFYNHGHANTYGQKKITEFLGRYISDTMQIGPSELDDSSKASWDGCRAYYDAFIMLSDELMHQKKNVTLGDSPRILRDLDRIIAGEDISAIADKYKPD